MNSTEVNGIRRKFIIIATLSFFVVITFTAGMTALANQYSLRTQAGHALELIVLNNGEMPEPTSSAKELHATDLFDGLFPEFTYSARYFSVLFNAQGNPVRAFPASGLRRAEHPLDRAENRVYAPARPWHFLYFLPLPHGQGSFRPTFAHGSSLSFT